MGYHTSKSVLSGDGLDYYHSSRKTDFFMHLFLDIYEFCNTLYEVRIIRPKDRDVVTNVFGLSAIVFNPQEGNNVLQHDLAKLDLK
ncbi:hypothetical protein Q0N88_19610 [Bacillus thuringiensis]|uniref:hypothetical protein n=1 Tax=Bacillus thuringiensis TaxID=1428 RepID=UPI00345AED46